MSKESGKDCVHPNLRVGFIGSGRMAQAMTKGFLSNRVVDPSNIIASDVDKAMLKFIKELGVNTTVSNDEVVKMSQVIIMAVKPNMVAPILQEISPSISNQHLVVSIAAGVTIATLEQNLPSGTRVIRVMPNVSALVLAAASAISPGGSVQTGDCELVTSLLSAVGICEVLEEKHLDTVTGLSGSGPAYAFMAIEALSDGGVRMGLPRSTATRLAAQTLLGAAKMVLETGRHPDQLKDDVCSPGGTTIAAVYQLEKAGFRGALMEAVATATLKSKELGKEN
ncbi:hypothetical protein ScPMuIL_009191 [Solemya velum]